MSDLELTREAWADAVAGGDYFDLDLCDEPRVKAIVFSLIAMSRPLISSAKKTPKPRVGLVLMHLLLVERVKLDVHDTFHFLSLTQKS